LSAARLLLVYCSSAAAWCQLLVCCSSTARPLLVC
jgi:hypothetical protein